MPSGYSPVWRHSDPERPLRMSATAGQGGGYAGRDAARTGWGGIFSRKRGAALERESEDQGGLRRAVGSLDLMALGIGGTIGTGIFVIIGEAIGDSGPAIILSFVLAGLTALFSAFSYAELASAVPVSGSAYTYIYATLGEIIAWIIGWDLILEYGLSIAAIASGWGQYLNDLLGHIFGGGLPTAISVAPGAEGGTFNLPSAFLGATMS